MTWFIEMRDDNKDEFNSRVSNAAINILFRFKELQNLGRNVPKNKKLFNTDQKIIATTFN